MPKKTNCATREDVFKNFNGEKFTLTFSTTRKKEQSEYLKRYREGMKKNKTRYRRVKKGNCYLLYTK